MLAALTVSIAAFMSLALARMSIHIHTYIHAHEFMHAYEYAKFNLIKNLVMLQSKNQQKPEKRSRLNKNTNQNLHRAVNEYFERSM